MPDEQRPRRAEPARRRRSDRDDGPVLPPDSHDDREVGWGDEPGERDADWYRRERPPHHE